MVCGIVFPNSLQFREAVTRYAIAQGRNVKIDVRDKKRLDRIGVRCVKGCPFKIYASWDNKLASYIVKSVDGKHTCQRNMESNIQFKASWCAEHLLELFKSRPHIPSSELVDIVRKSYKIIISRGFAYKIKYAAHKKLHGSMKQHYSKVMSYLEALKKSSPNSHFTITTLGNTNPPIFQRFFVCFDGLKDGWLNGCRKVLCIDGCFLKTFLGGMLLSAVGRDANEQMYPLAWAIVEGENNDSWQWFIAELKKAVGDNNGNGWTIISDEHQSILRAVKIELPEAEHRHCARHIYTNWNKTFKGEEMKLLFWTCAKAYNEADFYEGMKAMEKVNPIVVESFKKYDPRVFCRAYVKTNTKCEVILSNLVETFNNYIMQARSKHVIDMLEDISTMLMKRLAVKKDEATTKWSGILCPKVQAILDKEKEEASNCTVMPSTTTLFQVSHLMDVLEVDINKKTCTCKKWNLRGIPCCHGVAAICYLHKDVESFVDECYSIRAYSGSIPPCTGERHWPRVEMPLDPPPIKIGPGRPRKNRFKSPHEDPKKSGKLTRHGVQMTCSLCNTLGHNKRKCLNKDKVSQSAPPLKKGKGRPKKNQTEGNNTTIPHSTLAHHGMTAQPGAIGRGGRTIFTGQGIRKSREKRSTIVSSATEGAMTMNVSQTLVDINSTQASTTNL